MIKNSPSTQNKNQLSDTSIFWVGTKSEQFLVVKSDSLVEAADIGGASREPVWAGQQDLIGLRPIFQRDKDGLKTSPFDAHSETLVTISIEVGRGDSD